MLESDPGIVKLKLLRISKAEACLGDSTLVEYFDLDLMNHNLTDRMAVSVNGLQILMDFGPERRGAK